MNVLRRALPRSTAGRQAPAALPVRGGGGRPGQGPRRDCAHRPVGLVRRADLEYRHMQADGRLRCWRPISEADGRWLRVIPLEDGQTIHHAFFDRRVFPCKFAISLTPTRSTSCSTRVRSPRPATSTRTPWWSLRRRGTNAPSRWNTPGNGSSYRISPSSKRPPETSDGRLADRQARVELQDAGLSIFEYWSS